MNLRLRWISCSLAALVLSACTTHQRPEFVAERSLSGLNTDARQTALAKALAEAEQASLSGLNTTESRQRYNAAVSSAVKLWVALSNDERSKPLVCTQGDKSFTLQASWPKKIVFDTLIDAHDIESREMKRRITREGVGEPFVAWWKFTDERAAKEPFMASAGYLSPLTATITFSKGSNGKQAASLVLHDPRSVKEVRLAGASRPLAEDITAVGEFLLSRSEVRMSGLGALLRSGKNLDKLGLIALERPDPERVPVVLVHGLMSRPATWQNVVNELWSDPKLQRTTQFYFFRYPTGVPVIYSAAKLRERLGVLHRELNVHGVSPGSREMVLIGHSMGGLVSKAQVQSSGDKLWVNVFGSTPDRLNLSQKEIDALRSYLEYQPNPYVSRVIFVATPHRGSSLAAGTFGAIGRGLVNLPNHIMSDAVSMLQGEAPEHGPLADMLRRGVPTSIDNLSPKSKFVQTSINLPLRPGLHVHSIIGNKKQKPLNDPACSDGFVPYTSAHLDGVESEKIVPYGHSAHEHPMAVEEIRRILHEHVRGL